MALPKLVRFSGIKVHNASVPDLALSVETIRDAIQKEVDHIERHIPVDRERRGRVAAKVGSTGVRFRKEMSSPIYYYEVTAWNSAGEKVTATVTDVTIKGFTVTVSESAVVMYHTSEL